MTDNIQYKLENNGNTFCAYDGDTKIGNISFAKTDAGTIIIDYTGVNNKYQGKNIGTELVKRVVELAREQDKRIIPVCSFARSVFQKHPEFDDVRIAHGN